MRTWQGQPRKLLLHANRNGFFYVLDRTNGKLLLAKPFVKTSPGPAGIGATGAPCSSPGRNRRPRHKACPAVEGATNWFSTSFNPATGLYYVQTLEKCTHLHPDPRRVAGRPFLFRRLHAERARRAGAEVPAGDRHRKPAASPGSCRRPARPSPGAACSAPPPAWCSSARTAGR